MESVAEWNAKKSELVAWTKGTEIKNFERGSPFESVLKMELNFVHCFSLT